MRERDVRLSHITRSCNKCAVIVDLSLRDKSRGLIINFEIRCVSSKPLDESQIGLILIIKKRFIHHYILRTYLELGCGPERLKGKLVLKCGLSFKCICRS